MTTTTAIAALVENAPLIIEGALIAVSILFIGILVIRSARQNKQELAALQKQVAELVANVSRETGAEGNETIAPPTELLETVQKYDAHFSTLAKGLREYQRSVETSLEKMFDNIKRQDGMMGGIRDYLANRNELTTRLQEGYDYRILKNFVKQIIRCIHQIDSTIQAEQASSTDPNALIMIRSDLVDMLDRQGIEKILPEVGSSFSELRKIAEVVPQKEPTLDQHLAGKVASVIRPGYRYMIHHDQHRVLVPAQVKVYEFSRSK